MIEQLKNWFVGRSPREQWLLAAAAVLAGLVVLVYGLLFPGINAIEAAEKDLDAAIERRGRIEARAELFRKVPARPAQSAPALPAGQTLENFVKESAAAAGFEIAEGSATGANGFALRMASVKAGALLAWLSRLAAQGVEATEIRLRKGEGGFVAADVTLERRP
ncbi:MAG: type II secretion system protein GspM [Sphingorhabdus sp.]